MHCLANLIPLKIQPCLSDADAVTLSLLCTTFYEMRKDFIWKSKTILPADWTSEWVELDHDTTLSDEISSSRNVKRVDVRYHQLKHINLDNWPRLEHIYIMYDMDSFDRVEKTKRRQFYSNIQTLLEEELADPDNIYDHSIYDTKHVVDSQLTIIPSLKSYSSQYHTQWTKFSEYFPNLVHLTLCCTESTVIRGRLPLLESLRLWNYHKGLALSNFPKLKKLVIIDCAITSMKSNSVTSIIKINCALGQSINNQSFPKLINIITDELWEIKLQGMNLAFLQMLSHCQLVGNTYGELILHKTSTLKDTVCQKITYLDQKEMNASITMNDDINWIGESRIKKIIRLITPTPPRSYDGFGSSILYNDDDHTDLPLQLSLHQNLDDYYEDEFGQLRQIE